MGIANGFRNPGATVFQATVCDTKGPPFESVGVFPKIGRGPPQHDWLPFGFPLKPKRNGVRQVVFNTSHIVMGMGIPLQPHSKSQAITIGQVVWSFRTFDLTFKQTLALFTPLMGGVVYGSFCLFNVNFLVTKLLRNRRWFLFGPTSDDQLFNNSLQECRRV